MTLTDQPMALLPGHSEISRFHSSPEFFIKVGSFGKSPLRVYLNEKITL